MFVFGLLLVYSFSPVVLQIVFLPDRPLSIKSMLHRASAKEKHKEIFPKHVSLGSQRPLFTPSPTLGKKKVSNLLSYLG